MMVLRIPWTVKRLNESVLQEVGVTATRLSTVVVTRVIYIYLDILCANRREWKTDDHVDLLTVNDPHRVRRHDGGVEYCSAKDRALIRGMCATVNGSVS